MTVPAHQLWRYRLAARVVIYAIALGTLDGDSQGACDRFFRHWVSRPGDELREYAAALEREARSAGKRGALAIAEGLERIGAGDAGEGGDEGLFSEEARRPRSPREERRAP